MNVLRERMRAYLSRSSVGVLTVLGPEGMSAMPVRYRAENLELDCLVPRWADIAYHVETGSEAWLVILAVLPSSAREPLCWLQYRGKARAVENPDWTDLLPAGACRALAADLYLVVRVAPERLDLMDESQGWGARETLEMGSADC